MHKTPECGTKTSHAEVKHKFFSFLFIHGNGKNGDDGDDDDDDVDQSNPRKRLKLMQTQIFDIVKMREVVQNFLLNGKAKPRTYTVLEQALPALQPALRDLKNGLGLYEGRHLWQELSAYYFPGVSTLPSDLQTQLSQGWFSVNGTKTEAQQTERAWYLFYSRAWFWNYSLKLRVSESNSGLIPRGHLIAKTAAETENDNSGVNLKTKFEDVDDEFKDRNEYVKVETTEVWNGQNDRMAELQEVGENSTANDSIYLELFLSFRNSEAKLIEFETSLDSEFDDQFFIATLKNLNQKNYDDLPDFMNGEVFTQFYVNEEEYNTYVRGLAVSADNSEDFSGTLPTVEFALYVYLTVDWAKLAPDDATDIHNRCLQTGFYADDMFTRAEE